MFLYKTWTESEDFAVRGIGRVLFFANAVSVSLVGVIAIPFF